LGSGDNIHHFIIPKGANKAVTSGQHEVGGDIVYHILALKRATDFSQKMGPCSKKKRQKRQRTYLLGDVPQERAVQTYFAEHESSGSRVI